MLDNRTPNEKPLDAWIRALRYVRSAAEDRRATLPGVLHRLAEEFGDKPALISSTDSLTYRGLAERANQYARWASSQGVRRGTVVGLVMPNCAEYAAAWLGITQTGGVVALVNTNLSGDALAHSLRTAGAGHVIASAETRPAVEDVVSRFMPEVQCWVCGPAPVPGQLATDMGIDRYSGASVPATEERPTATDRALLIFTSGTTGLPKAANISHARLLEWSYWFAGMMDTRADDRMYNCLPMYHSVGGVVAIGALLVTGGTVIIRPTFSARRFWDDVVSHDCTLFQYIGELCRYLVNQPPNPQETQHRLRLCCGNGLRRDVWSVFQERFRIPQILEYYASTEGNVSLYNCENKPGAIGRVPSFLWHRFPVTLIKVSETGVPLRDGMGVCVRCAPDEVGEAIGRIINTEKSQTSWFDGYTDAAASEAKVLRNAFEEGDMWFRTGDLMLRDTAGFYYFVDRIGETFRWKGENVSTSQVAEQLCGCPGVSQAVVYGVTVPHTEGKAGMAAIVVESGFSIATLRQHLTARLPDYACPLFLRITDTLHMTGTFKPTALQFAREGYDPLLIHDRLYFNDRSSGEFVELDTALFAQIVGGDLRL